MAAPGPDKSTLQLADGAVIPVRPIAATDAEALQRFHGRLSERSIYLRHFGLVPTLSEKQARYFTQLDGIQRFALVALDPNDPNEIIAVVRFDRDLGTDQAEYAALVEDRWQGRGIGLGLTRLLIEAARRRGVKQLYALVMPDNVRMRRLLRHLALPERVRSVNGIERVEVDIAAAEPPSVPS